MHLSYDQHFMEIVDKRDAITSQAYQVIELMNNLVFTVLLNTIFARSQTIYFLLLIRYKMLFFKP